MASVQRKRQRTGLIVLGAALGAGAVGFFVGRLSEPEPPPGRPPLAPLRYAAPFEEAESPAVVLFDETAPEAPPPALEAAAAALGEGADIRPAELVDELARDPTGEWSQILLVGMVANAKKRGGAALPEIRQLLDSGVDIKFPDYDGKGLGYPSLRTALLAAAEATGDPAAREMIAEVARTAESPVEVVFGAHLLDRLDALDPATAQRALESLGKPLPPEQRQAMESIAGRVVPAAAAADPAYAENYLATQLRMPKGTGADPRLVAAVLDGLSAERAQALVIGNLTAADVSDRAKHALAARATQRGELEMLGELRRGIEAGIVTADVAATIAQTAVASRSFGRLERDARRALKEGDLDTARAIATSYHARLGETEQTINAARAAGAKLKRELPTFAQLQRQRLDSLRAQIAQALKRRQQQAQPAR